MYSKHLFVTLIIACLTIIHCNSCFATGIEEAKSQCREKIRPIVQSCVRQNVLAKGGSPEPVSRILPRIITIGFYVPSCADGDGKHGSIIPDPGRVRSRDDITCF